MKLKNKIYLLQLFIALSFTVFFFLFYNGYIEQKQKDLQYNIETIAQTNKLFIEQSLKLIYKEYSNQQKLFYNIHQYAQKEFVKNPDQNLKELKSKIKNQYNLTDIDVDIYIIDKTYTITNTTFQKDIGFNLSVIEDAKKYLDQTKKDNKIYVASNISIDMIDANLNVYSYSKISDSLYFELGFKLQNQLYQELKDSLNRVYKITHNKIDIYRVIETADKKEIYNNLFEDKSQMKISKAEFEKSLKKFDKDQTTDDKHINAVRFNKTLSEIVGSQYIVYAPLLQKGSTKTLLYNNLLMKIYIDISEYRNTLEATKQNFYIFGCIVFFFLLLLFYFTKYNFYKPMTKITQNFESEKKIEDEMLLKKTDEFGILVEKYNKLYDSLKNEIQLNENLLLENKRFIADTVHQIRTPLTNIMMNGEMVKRFQRDDSLSLFIDQIDASINMLSNSYEDLAYITSYDTIEYKPSKISLSDMLNKRIKFFATISKVNFKEIVSDIQSDISIFINEIECERIIDNNISNGIKYADENKPIAIHLTKSDDATTLQFKTYGKPIQNKERVFEKNYRENEAKRGLGLGLNMVKGICQKYNIQYFVTYEYGQNIFTYTFQNG